MKKALKNKEKKLKLTTLGFTLIELLAVIVILAVIALIATPMIMGVIDEARRGALRSDVYSVVDATETYLMTSSMNGVEPQQVIDLKESDLIKYKGGNFTSGKVYIDKNGNIAVALSNGSVCAKKNYTDKEAVITESSVCEFNVLDYAVGQEVVLDGDSYHVLAVTNKGYKLIKDDSLGDMKYDNNSAIYMPTTNVEAYDYGVLKNVNETFDNESSLYSYLNNEWKETLSYKDKIIDDVLLITVSEYRELDGKNVPWLNTGVLYWTMTPAYYNGELKCVASIDAGGNIRGNVSSMTNSSGNAFNGYYYNFAGVRPVIIIASIESVE